jgi:hypothetical protein
VGNKATIITPAITVSTSIYAADDVVGGRLTLTNAMRVSSGTGLLTDILMTCADGETFGSRILLFDTTTASSIADQSPFTWGAGDHAKLLAIVNIATGDFTTIAGDTVAHKQNLNILVAANGSANLYAYVLATGTPTFGAATDLSIRFKFVQD